MTKEGGMGESVRSAYRVELRAGARVEALAVLAPHVPVHHASLTPFVSRLRLDGRTTGEVVLVDRGTGAVVARRSLAPRRQRSRA
jgi:hypothetical protein